MDSGISILIADDNDSDRLILSAIVKKEGHTVLLAKDGQEAVDAFKAHQPDLVLMDALMPNKDGFEATQEIKELAGDQLIPVIFLTSLQDAESLVKCLDSGGDDFLSKPYNRIILKAKIKAFRRMQEMHASIQEHNRQLIIEQQVAKNIFDNVAHIGCLDEANIKYSLSPLAVFNGDTVLARRRPDGGMHLFVGDFTGHGLPAAIGAMPLAEIFYGMTSKGFSIHEIVREINEKLRTILPTGVFCCGGIIHLDFFEKSARVWVGGLPDCILYRQKTGELEKIQSKSLPLGVLATDKYQPHVEEFALEQGDKFYFWSDGIIESRNITGDMYGEERLHNLIANTRRPDQIFEEILQDVESFIGEGEADDDITLLEATMVDMGILSELEAETNHVVTDGPKDFSLELVLKPSTLRDYNPLPLVLHILTQVEGLRSKSGELYTIIAELYSNALEHGVLKLSSSLKKSTEGFAQYYLQRQARLEDLKEGFVRFSIQSQNRVNGGSLSLTVEDSGDGFDYQSVIDKPRNTSGFSGRGLPLLIDLCSKFEFKGKGNQVYVQLDWNL